MIYIICFFGSAISAYWATRFNNKKNRILVVLFSLISILIPSVLGGCRALSLGTDVQAYVVSHFNFARSSQNLISFLTNFNTSTGREPLYRVIIYVIASMTENVNWLLFVFQFLTIGLVYVGAYKHRKTISVPLVLLLFFCIYYNDTYNLVRQYLAMAIIFANIDSIERREYKKFIVAVIIAALVHTTAILALSMMVIQYFVSSGKLETKQFRKIILVFGIAFVCLFFRQIITILVSLGLLSNRYMYYFIHTSVSDNALDTLVYAVEVVILLLYSKRLTQTMEYAEFYRLNAYTFLATLQLSRVMHYGSRISLFFGFINIFLLAGLPGLAKTQKNKVLSKLFIIVVALFYWWYIYVHGGVSETYPYMSFWN